MHNIVLQVVGVALVVLGGQGLVRLVVDPTDTGLLAWLPGGFLVALAGHLLVLAAGIVLAARAQRGVRARRR